MTDSKRDDLELNPSFNYKEPETLDDLHRPPGVPRPREIKSQKAQLKSTHQHGTSKDCKIKMSEKTGLAREDKK